MLIGAVPVFSSVSDRLDDELTESGPKARFVGVICRCDWMPVPVNEAVMGVVEAELAIESVPVIVPEIVGVKVIWREQLELKANVSPAVGQLPLETV